MLDSLCDALMNAGTACEHLGALAIADGVLLRVQDELCAAASNMVGEKLEGMRIALRLVTHLVEETQEEARNEWNAFIFRVPEIQSGMVSHRPGCPESKEGRQGSVSEGSRSSTPPADKGGTLQGW